MGLTRLFLLLLGLITSSVYSLVGPCYFPNGQKVSSNYACLNSGASPCCAGGYACLQNGLCQWTSLAGGSPPDSILIRGSCTDQSWKSDLCPNYCNTPNQDTVNGGVYMLKCPTNGAYYCDDASGSVANNCTGQGNAYSLSAEGFSTVTVIGQTSPTTGTVHSVTTVSVQSNTITATAAASSSFSSSSTSSSSSSSTSSSATSSDNKNTSSGTSTSASTSTSNGTPTTTSAPVLGVNHKATDPPSSSNSGLNTTALGIGLGVGLGVLAIAMLAAICLLKRRSRRVPSPPPLDPDTQGASYIPTYNHESVDHNDKFAPLLPPTSTHPALNPPTRDAAALNSPTSSTRYSDNPPPIYASNDARRSGYTAFSYPSDHANDTPGAHPIATELQNMHPTGTQGRQPASSEVHGAEIHEMP